MVATQETIDKVKEVSSTYKYGFVTDLEAEKAPLGLSEDIVKYISHKKKEPKWLLEWRLKAYKKWLTMEAPNWAMVDFPEINFQDIYYYSAPKAKPKLNSLDEVDPELLRSKKLIKLNLLYEKKLISLSKRFNSDKSIKSENTLYLKKCNFGLNLL